MHLDDEQLQLFLHRELNADSRRLASEHLTACAECRDRLFKLERDHKEVYRLLQSVDSPPPRVTAAEVAVRGGASRSAWGRLVAGILLAAALAGGAYAMPGSPLPDWMRGARDRIQGSEQPPKPTESPIPLMAGIAVPPGERLVILFEHTHPKSKVHVSVGDWADVRVRGPSGGATFGSEADTLRIGNRDSTATFEVEIPLQARKVEIRVAGARVFAKEGSRIVALGSDDGDESYTLPLSVP